jgi:Raf kinase inhibitor-like YbhB/YbcL family protein
VKQIWLLTSALALSCSNDGNGKMNDTIHALTIDRSEAQAPMSIQVSSPDFVAEGPIPARFSAYGKGISPAISWSETPAGTKSLALIVEDPDAPSVEPYVHWLIWNIEPSPRKLPEAIPRGIAPALPKGAEQGENTRGSNGYFGPRPPSGKPHHYHFQLFALDTMLSLTPGSKREDVLKAINGHVLAKGDLIGLFQKP